MDPISDYIAQFPPEVQERLHRMRDLIREAAPDVAESISYGMPAYKTQGKPLVYFAGYAKHVGFYATPTGHEAFADRLSGYKQGKGSVQFPLSEPLPEALIRDIVQFRVKENLQASKSR